MNDFELLRAIGYLERTRRPYRAAFPMAEDDPVWNILGAVYSADLPTVGAAKESGASSNCFASLWNWLNATVSDCPLTYHGFTVYSTVDGRRRPTPGRQPCTARG